MEDRGRAADPPASATAHPSVCRGRAGARRHRPAGPRRDPRSASCPSPSGRNTGQSLLQRHPSPRVRRGRRGDAWGCGRARCQPPGGEHPVPTFPQGRPRALAWARGAARGGQPGTVRSRVGGCWLLKKTPAGLRVEFPVLGPPAAAWPRVSSSAPRSRFVAKSSDVAAETQPSAREARGRPAPRRGAKPGARGRGGRT